MTTLDLVHLRIVGPARWHGHTTIGPLPALLLVLDNLGVVDLGVRDHADEEGPLVLQVLPGLVVHQLAQDVRSLLGVFDVVHAAVAVLNLEIDLLLLLHSSLKAKNFL